MDEIVRSIKFPIVFDVEKLQDDLKKIINENWIAHYNTDCYSGKWNSIALMSPNGKSDTIYAFSATDEKLVATEILDSCTYFKEILDGFLFEKTAVRLLQLAAGAEVKPHSDNCLGYEDNCFRLHIPIITNSEVEPSIIPKGILISADVRLICKAVESPVSILIKFLPFNKTSSPKSGISKSPFQEISKQRYRQ